MSYLESPIFTLNVGKDYPRQFAVHTSLLNKESDMLAQSTKNGFMEQHTKEIRLEEEDPDLFGFFVEYL